MDVLYKYNDSDSGMYVVNGICYMHQALSTWLWPFDMAYLPPSSPLSHKLAGINDVFCAAAASVSIRAGTPADLLITPYLIGHSMCLRVTLMSVHHPKRLLESYRPVF